MDILLADAIGIVDRPTSIIIDPTVRGNSSCIILVISHFATGLPADCNIRTGPGLNRCSLQYPESRILHNLQTPSSMEILS